MGELKKGLEGVYAAASSLCFINGKKGILRYRGYSIEELARFSCFEEVTFLLWYEKLPTKEELEKFKQALVKQRMIPPKLIAWMRTLSKKTHAMMILRTAVSMLAEDAPLSHVNKETALHQATQITAQIPVIVATWNRIQQGKNVVYPHPHLDHAANFLYMLQGKAPSNEDAKACDVALILHAEHDFNASTFAARVTASTLSDFFSCITTALGTLQGPLHGGANEQVTIMLNEIKTPGEAEKYVLQKLERHEKIMGLGHRVYKVKDPRAVLLEEWVKKLCDDEKKKEAYEKLKKIEETMKKEKGLFPNVDFFSGLLYEMLAMPREVFVPFFAMARTAGWSAHVLEQYQNNRLIRPLSLYTGKKQTPYAPIEQRR